MTDLARLSAAIKYALLIHRHDLELRSQADLMAIAEQLAADLIVNAGVMMPVKAEAKGGRRALAETTPTAN